MIKIIPTATVLHLMWTIKSRDSMATILDLQDPRVVGHFSTQLFSQIYSTVMQL